MKTDTELMSMALEQRGIDSQLNMVIEECAELIDAIQKWRRERIDWVQVLEEAVDVELCVEQLKMILNAPTLFENMRKEKLERLEKLLSREGKLRLPPQHDKVRYAEEMLNVGEGIIPEGFDTNSYKEG